MKVIWDCLIIGFQLVMLLLCFIYNTPVFVTVFIGANAGFCLALAFASSVLRSLK